MQNNPLGMKDFQILDVSGLGNAGKSAVVDFLREFQPVHSFEYSFEFDLLRLPNGILDLEHHLVQSWSPIRSNYALRAFDRLCYKLAGSQMRKNIKAFLFSSGHGYEARFDGEFLKLAREFSSSFVVDEYQAFWPYYLLEDSLLSRAIKKIKLKAKATDSLLSPIYLVDGQEFSKKCSAFVHKLFARHMTSDKKLLTLNNCFDAFDPERSLNLIENSKSIIVYRDPRDVFVSGLNASKVQKSEDRKLQAFDNNGINKSFLGGDNIQTFIKRQNLYFSKLYKGKDSRVKLIRFEDFVLNHKKIKQEILDFLELTPQQQTQKETLFRVEKSAQNIGIWKQYSNADEINYIVKNLEEKWMLFDAQ